MLAHPCQLMFKFGNLEITTLQFRHQVRRKPPEFIGVCGQDLRVIRHGHCIAELPPKENPWQAFYYLFLLNYPALNGRHVRCGIRQSIPSNSIANWAGVTLTLPCAGDGQTNRPRSKRFENRHAP